MTASVMTMGTYPSPTVETTWMTISARQKRERLRWTDWDRKRGHRSVVQPTDATVPRTTVADRTINDTRPVARVRYHNAVEPCPTVATRAVIMGRGLL